MRMLFAWFVICANTLGSCKGSTGPASVNPATGELYRLDFPNLTLEDVANASFELVRGLGSDARIVTGASGTTVHIRQRLAEAQAGDGVRRSGAPPAAV